MVDRKRYRRAWFYGTNTLLSSVVFLAILSLVALIAERHPWRVDLSEAGKFTLSQQTQKILDSLKEPITIKAFFATAGPNRSPAKDLLDSYQYRSRLISYEFVDPDRQPELARRYDIRSYGTLVVEGFQKKQVVQQADEQNLTNAIFKLTHEENKKIYFLTGQGERSTRDTDKNGYSAVASALQKANYEVLDFNLLQQPHVPADAAAVIVAGPRKILMEPVIEALKGYLHRGGKLFLLLDPFQDAGLAGFTAGYGIELHDDIIIDQLSRVFGGSFLMPVVTQYGVHRITDGFDLATFYPEARSVRVGDEPPAGVRPLVLASTSQEAWAETDQEKLRQGHASYEADRDLHGPVPIVALAEVERDAPARDGHGNQSEATEGQDAPNEGSAPRKAKGVLVVCGNSGFADNTHFSLSGNGDFFLNILNYLAEEETLITIERRAQKGQPLILSQSQARLIFWVSLVLVPVAVLAAGLAVYRVRRSQR